MQEVGNNCLQQLSALPTCQTLLANHAAPVTSSTAPLEVGTIILSLLQKGKLRPSEEVRRPQKQCRTLSLWSGDRGWEGAVPSPSPLRTPNPGPKTGRQWPGQPCWRAGEGPGQTADRVSQNLQYGGGGGGWGYPQGLWRGVGRWGIRGPCSGLREGARLFSIPPPL